MEFRWSTFEEIGSERWNALLEKSQTDVPFLRFEFQLAWWEGLGGGEWSQAELALITAWDGDELVGIAPLFGASYQGRQALLWIGSIEIADYLDFIVPSALAADFVRGVVDFLERAAAWQVLALYNLPESSPTCALLAAEANRRGWKYEEGIYQPTPYIPLSGDFEAYLAGIDKKQRHEIRRKLRRAAEYSLPVRWRLIGSQDDLEAAMQTLFDLMRQDEEKARFLTPAMESQLRRIARAAQQAGWLHLSFLEIGGEAAAASLNFDYRNRLWGYNSGVSLEFRDLSPGWVCLAHVLQWACAHGRSEFDFMRGNEEYKYRFGARDRYVMWLTLERQ
ncbi:MAG: GNAT family N-acetyltransferase [Anaerolineales bacterium]